MSANSNHGPPDLDVVFRELLGFLFKKRNRQKKPREQNPLKRLFEQETKKHFEKKRSPKQTSTTTIDNQRDDRQAQQSVQGQNRKKQAAPQTQASIATNKNDTHGTIAQRMTDYRQSRMHPTETIKADKAVKQNVNASSTREWLHDPRALRQAFVLKELLEPPIALRKSPRRRYS